MNRIAFLTIAMAWLGWGAAPAAELQLRARCQPRGAIVLLGDVAEIAATDPGETARLAATELFPAPPPGLQKVLRARELRDLLADRGIGMAEHRLSGSNQVLIEGSPEPARTAEPPPVAAWAMRQARRVVENAIVQHLEAHVSPDDAWQVEALLTEPLARHIPTDAAKIAARGGRAPWTGTQEFELFFHESSPSQSLAVTAKVTRLPRIVVAVRTIARGETIRPADVVLRRPEPNATVAGSLHSIDEVAGMEASQTILAGTVLQRSQLRSPILVRRGELITVYSRAAGIRIRTTARSKEDAALGELVALESLHDRKTFTARVCGAHEAEVYARAVQTTPVAAREPAAQAGAETTESFERIAP